MIPNMVGLLAGTCDPNGNSSYNSDESMRRRMAALNNAFGNSQPQFVSIEDYNKLLQAFEDQKKITEAGRANLDARTEVFNAFRKELARVDPNNKLLQNSTQRKPDGSIRTNVNVFWWDAFCRAIKKRLGPSADPEKYAKM